MPENTIVAGPLTHVQDPHPVVVAGAAGESTPPKVKPPTAGSASGPNTTWSSVVVPQTSGDPGEPDTLHLEGIDKALDELIFKSNNEAAVRFAEGMLCAAIREEMARACRTSPTFPVSLHLGDQRVFSERLLLAYVEPAKSHVHDALLEQALRMAIPLVAYVSDEIRGGRATLTHPEVRQIFANAARSITEPRKVGGGAPIVEGQFDRLIRFVVAESRAGHNKDGDILKIVMLKCLPDMQPFTKDEVTRLEAAVKQLEKETGIHDENIAEAIQSYFDAVSKPVADPIRLMADTRSP